MIKTDYEMTSEQMDQEIDFLERVNNADIVESSAIVSESITDLFG